VGFEELTALGNAVVPQVGEHLGRLFMAHANAHREVPLYGAEGTVCAADGDWWPCETVAPRDDEAELIDLAICGGCGAYGRLGRFHVRNGEECGEFA
jgi:hypothetical protein